MKKLFLLTACLLCGFFSFAQKQFWGMSKSNGAVKGTIFKTDSSGNNYTDVYTFSNAAEGLDPYGSLTKASDGLLYGLTSSGGAFNRGTIFQLNPNTGVYTRKHDFDSINGQHPYGSLMQASNGKLYGMTYNGGAWKRGVLFSFDISTSVFTRLFDFDMMKGALPYGSALTEAPDGKLYGLSSAGGGDATGALFQFDPATGDIALKQSFILGAIKSGYDPRGSLTLATDGNLYGFSRYGQPGFESGGGVLFKYDLSVVGDAFQPIYYFDEGFPGSLNGFELMGTPVQASNGKLYGMTSEGGADGAGTIFEYDITADTLIKRYDFNRLLEGYRPYGSLMQASDGRLYGLLSSDSGQARMFRFDINSYTLTLTADVTGTPFYTTLIETGRVTSGLKEEMNTLLRIFPNPAQDLIRIDIPDGVKINEIRITDLSGKLIRTQNGSSKSMAVSDLPSGNYLLEIRTDQQTICRQFVKQGK